MTVGPIVLLGAAILVALPFVLFAVLLSSLTTTGAVG